MVHAFDQPCDSGAHSRSLAHKAYEYSIEKNYESPFSKEARSAGREHRGGKQDDISVMIARIAIK